MAEVAKVHPARAQAVAASVSATRTLQDPDHAALCAAAKAAPEGEGRALERAAREVDDGPRRTLFQALAEARGTPRAAAVEARVCAALGPPEAWVRAFHRFTSRRLARMVLIPTWECELRCSYCWIPKQGGRVMSVATAERGVDLLMSASGSSVNLQFFGGEALLERALVEHAITYALDRAAAVGKRVDFVLSSNGWSLDDDALSWLSSRPVKLELSLDGDPATQITYRRSNIPGEDSYTRSIAAHAGAIQASGLPYDVIMVVQPRTASRLAANFLHIVGLGFTRVQINFALGVRWTRAHITTFAAELHALGVELERRWARGDDVTLINLENGPLPVRLNGEIHVDYDGTIYGSNGFLHEPPTKAEFAVGHLDDLAGFDRYWLDAPDNDFLLERTYPPDITRNNLAVGRVLTSFLRHLAERRPAAPAAVTASAAPV